MSWDDLSGEEREQVDLTPPEQRRVDNDVNIPVRVRSEQESTAWIFTEVASSGDWDPMMQGVADVGSTGSQAIDAVASSTAGDMSSTRTAGDAYYNENAPLPEATRRFEMYCGVPAVVGGRWADHPTGPYLGMTEVGLTDPFWDPRGRIGSLWNSISLDTFSVVRAPEVETYGGLVVNMPTGLQVDASAWRPYFSQVDEYMGWQQQLSLWPSELEFTVDGVDGVGTGSHSCDPPSGEGGADGGAIPGIDYDSLPRYWEPAAGEFPDGTWCVWVPHSTGDVTIRATITYDVLYTVSGYSEWLAPYVWSSDPLTLPVGELRNVNVTPEGGI